MRIWHCKTRNEYNFLMEQLEAKGFKWEDGTPLGDFDAYAEEEEGTLCIWEDEKISYLTLQICKKCYPAQTIHPVAIPDSVKPVFPEYIVEYVEKVKEKARSVHEFLDRIVDDAYWLGGQIAWKILFSENICTDTLARAYLFGYKVEYEKRYTVILPNPNYKTGFKSFLCKDKNGKIFLANKKFDLQENTKLTEREIKEFDERYFHFAQEVERDDIH